VSGKYDTVVVAGSGRSQDGTKNEIQYALMQDLTAISSRQPVFGTAATFRLPGVAGADTIFPTDVTATDMDADERADVVIADSLNGSVAVARVVPTISGTTVT